MIRKGVPNTKCVKLPGGWLGPASLARERRSIHVAGDHSHQGALLGASAISAETGFDRSDPSLALVFDCRVAWTA